MPDPFAAHHPFAEHIGLRLVSAADGTSRTEVDVRPDLHNPQGVLHGAVPYAMADTGMGAALYTQLEDGELCATIDVRIAYFAPIREGSLRCETTVLNRGKRVAELESKIHLDDRLVASASGSFAIFRPRG